MRFHNTIRNRNTIDFLRKQYPFSLVMVSVIVESYRFVKTSRFKADAEFDFDVLEMVICGVQTKEIAHRKKVTIQKVQRTVDRFMAQFWAVNGAALDVEFDRKQRLI